MADQEKFHYQIPETDSPSRWDGLSEHARKAVTGAADGPGPADELPVTRKAEGTLSPEAREWAEEEISGALNSWSRYNENLTMVPGSFDQFMDMNPNREETISRLFGARSALVESADITPGGMNIGESMNLVLIPWADFETDATRLHTWITRWRNAQGKTEEVDLIDQRLMDAINNDAPLYRDPDDPSTSLKSSEYLQGQIAQSGLWGVMLAQTKSSAGITSPLLESQAPDNLTNHGDAHLRVGGCDVDAMGIFEWLSLSLQEKPRSLSPADKSLLLANRIYTDIGAMVPAANWEAGMQRVAVDLQLALNGEKDTNPRLAVMASGVPE